MKQQEFYTLVVGAGPAGLAAAISAAQSGKSVALLDDNPLPGGQIWRQGSNSQASEQANSWFRGENIANICTIQQARVIAPLKSQSLLVETPDEARELQYRRLILTTGARERFLPFPGWTLPGVMGAGGLQALVKGGLPIRGKRVVVAGTGPLLLAVASYLKSKGANICAIIEQVSWTKLGTFACQLPLYTRQFKQAGGIARQLLGVPFYANSWVIKAQGTNYLETITLRRSDHLSTIPCDYLAFGFGLVPNNELPAALGCTLIQGAVQVDAWQKSSQEQVYCAGEVTGIGGMDLALYEGQIAGFAATEQLDKALKHFAARKRARRFANLLEQTFQLRAELKTLPDATTLVCRCEDVSYQALKEHTSWRSAKLQTRCGMGTCQGRVCGAATDFLFGWTQDSIRIPIAPANIDSLISDQAIDQ